MFELWTIYKKDPSEGFEHTRIEAVETLIARPTPNQITSKIRMCYQGPAYETEVKKNKKILIERI